MNHDDDLHSHHYRLPVPGGVYSQARGELGLHAKWRPWHVFHRTHFNADPSPLLAFIRRSRIGGDDDDDNTALIIFLM